MLSLCDWRKRITLTQLILLVSATWSMAQTSPVTSERFEVEAGVRIPMVLMNSLSSRNAHVGDQLYLHTMFPVTVEGKIVIPPGSYVQGSILELKRPGRVRGKGEMLIGFDRLILPNGVTRSLTGSLRGLDGRVSEQVEEGEGRIQADSSTGRDAAIVATTGGTGAAIGAAIGHRSGRTGTGAAIGAASGVLAALLLVLLTRGLDVYLARGTTMDMILLKPLVFETHEVKFTEAELSRNPLKDIPDPAPAPIIWRRYPYPFPGAPAIIVN